MSLVPVLGQAVQAPSVTAPNAVPRANASQVAARPTAAATSKAKNEPRSSRIGPLEWRDASIALGAAAGLALGRNRDGAGTREIRAALLAAGDGGRADQRA